MRKNMKLMSLTLILLLFEGMGGGSNLASAQDGTCVSVEFKKNDYGEINRSSIVKVLRENAPLYANSSDMNPKGTLSFNTNLLLMDFSGHRLQVKDLGTDEILGWMEKTDLLCQLQPLLSPRSGLEQKLYIRTKTSPRQSDPLTVTAFPEPEIQECYGRCAYLSRFATYFVVAASSDSYLLSPVYELRYNDDLIGWIHREDGFIWDTAYAIRPKEDLGQFPSGHELEGQERAALLYYSLDDALARNQDEASPVLGGMRWYHNAQRIPLLDRLDIVIFDQQEYDQFLVASPFIREFLKPFTSPVLLPDTVAMTLPQDTGQLKSRLTNEAFENLMKQRQTFYHVMLPLSGLTVDPSEDLTKVKIHPNLLATEPREIDIDMEFFEHIDVFFLIDGTYSMQPYIGQVRGTPGNPGIIQEIITQIENDERYQGAKFRFGFRVYRDSYAEDKELGEGMSLDNDCSYSDESLRQNKIIFERRLQTVQASLKDTNENIKEDYEENLFGGIKRVFTDDIANCSDSTKLLFIIGDHGYKQNGSITAKTIADGLCGDSSQGLRDIQPFFLQTPLNCKDRNNPSACKNAYHRFVTQAVQVLSGMSLPVELPRTVWNTLPQNFREQFPNGFSIASEEGGTSTAFHRMDSQELNTHLVQQVTPFGRTDLYEAVKEELITADRRGGKALVTIIEDLQREARFQDIPGVVFDQIKQGLCKRLGPQCEHKIYDTVIPGYVPLTDEFGEQMWVEDVWLTSDALRKWIDLLVKLEGLIDVYPSELRQQLISMLMDALQDVLKKPSYDEVQATNPDLTFAQYIQRIGKLPVRDNSPLFTYRAEDLEEPRRVGDTELVCLTTWLQSSLDILTLVKGNERPQFQTVTSGMKKCVHIPEISGSIRGENFPEDGMRYDPLGGSGSMCETESMKNNAMCTQHFYWVPKEYLP